MYKYFKRIIDFLVSLFLLLILAPVILIIAIVVKIKLGSPVLFKQKRPGRNQKIFVIYKFRTMTGERDEKGNLLPDKDRLAAFGSLLRKTSLDELPSLFNVIKGDMSLIGPRPLLVKYLPLYNEKQQRRHEIRPGLTGWAQVNGRNAISWEQKFEYDVWYVENQSFLLDLKIIFFTFIKVGKREGISAEGEDTMPEFKGNLS